MQKSGRKTFNKIKSMSLQSIWVNISNGACYDQSLYETHIVNDVWSLTLDDL